MIRKIKAPSPLALGRLRPGDCVKICRNEERFWIFLTKVDGTVLEGTVNNHLVNPANADLPLHRPVSFERQYVYDIMTAAEGRRHRRTGSR
jgi:hypothetical protein